MSADTATAPPPPPVIVVGAGAAGLATAIFARRRNPLLPVTVVDGAARPGAKILVSGGSRCNVTNRVVTERDFQGGRRTIVRRVLRQFPVPDTIRFFDAIGVPMHEEEHGKLFPDSNRSRDVLDALLRELHASGAVLMAGTRVLGIERTESGFILSTSRGTMAAGTVVLATGGQSLPKSGSDGLGYRFAERLGHTIVPTTPALVPLVLEEDAGAIHRGLSGVSQDVELAVWVEGSVAARRSGSMLWTHFGISGPVVLDASRIWLRARLEGRACTITVSFLPGETFEAVEASWSALAAERPRTTVQNAMGSMVPASVAGAMLRSLGVDGAMPLARMPREVRRRLSHALVEWPLAVTDSRGYNYAEVTAGGVTLDEIDPSTMESRRCPGLFLVGEILDVDGRIGGFNFQWSWASARVAAGALAP